MRASSLYPCTDRYAAAAVDGQIEHAINTRQCMPEPWFIQETHPNPAHRVPIAILHAAAQDGHARGDNGAGRHPALQTIRSRIEERRGLGEVGLLGRIDGRSQGRRIRRYAGWGRFSTYTAVRTVLGA